MVKYCSVICLLLASVPNAISNFQVYDQWSKVDYEYKSRENDLKSGKLRPQDVVIYDAQLYMTAAGEETLFVTTPNLNSASPISLSTVTDRQSDGGPTLKPFPDESWYRGGCNSKITSAYKIKIDRLDRLWVLDSGMINHMTDNAHLVCPPQILIFDLKNNYRLIHQYQVPKDQHYDDSLLINIELDVRNKDGSDTMAYISDVKGYRMLVYDLEVDSSYPIDNPYFNPFPIYCFFRNINGVNFTLLDGLYSIALGAGSDPDRPLYFHSLSSAREGFVNLSVVDDETASKDAFNYEVTDVRGFHSSTELMTEDGFLIFANIEDNSIVVWDSTKPYKPDNFVTISKDDVQLQFITGMQLIGSDKLLVTSSRFQNVIVGKIPENEINYRVLINLNISQYITRK